MLEIGYDDDGCIAKRALMSRGKHISLEEARRYGKLSQFANEHPSEGNGKLWDRLFDAVIHGGPPDSIVKARASKTSAQGSSEDCSETQTRQDTSKDAGG